MYSPLKRAQTQTDPMASARQADAVVRYKHFPLQPGEGNGWGQLSHRIGGHIRLWRPIWRRPWQGIRLRPWQRIAFGPGERLMIGPRQRIDFRSWQGIALRARQRI